MSDSEKAYRDLRILQIQSRMNSNIFKFCDQNPFTLDKLGNKMANEINEANREAWNQGLVAETVVPYQPQEIITSLVDDLSARFGGRDPDFLPANLEETKKKLISFVVEFVRD